MAATDTPRGTRNRRPRAQGYGYLAEPDADLEAIFAPETLGRMGAAASCGPGGAFLAAARCPLCRWPLVARMGRGGPYFACACNTIMTATPSAPGAPAQPEPSTNGAKHDPKDRDAG
jgi:hypothetical protein